MSQSNGKNGGFWKMLTDRVVNSLPPGMLLLVLLNIGFLVTILRVVQGNADQRNVMLTKIIENCLPGR